MKWLDEVVQFLSLVLVFGLVLSYPLSTMAQQGAIELSALSSTERVLGTTGEIRDARSEAVVYSARNETESFQIVITARNAELEDVQVEMTGLKSDGGSAIDRDHIRLFREAYNLVRNSSPRATLAPGLFPDALVPFHNRYTGEPTPGGAFMPQGYDLWPGHHQPIWVDVSVPKGTAPGVYRGEVSVEADNAQAVEIPVTVHVWNFTLPDGPTHSSHFGDFGGLRRYYGIDSPELFQRLEMRYIRMTANHHINPPLPAHLHPPRNSNGSIRVTEDWDATFTEFIETYNVTDIEVPHPPYNYPLDRDREETQNFYRSWYEYLERKGWEDRAYLYMYDEPNSGSQYRRVRELAAVIEEAAPDLKRLIVEQPYTQNEEWGTLNEAIDIWCPLFGFVHEQSIEQVKQEGDEVWSYTALVQDAPDYHPNYEEVQNDDPPYWEIDFPLTSYRIPTWLNRRYGITGLLYWTMIQWSSDPDRNVWYNPAFGHGGAYNGGGQLIYPGDEVGIQGPVPSIRLKALRDGLEDYEYFALLEERGQEDLVRNAVHTMVPTWGSWKQEGQMLQKQRKKLGEALSK